MGDLGEGVAVPGKAERMFDTLPESDMLNKFNILAKYSSKQESKSEKQQRG